jgi:hypothetical protein
MPEMSISISEFYDSFLYFEGCSRMGVSNFLQSSEDDEEELCNFSFSLFFKTKI